jgi:hypothetical protein
MANATTLFLRRAIAAALLLHIIVACGVRR